MLCEMPFIYDTFKFAKIEDSISFLSERERV